MKAVVSWREESLTKVSSSAFLFVFPASEIFVLVCNPQLPDLVTQLGVLYHMIESRVKMFHKLTKLHGKLYLVMTQVSVMYRKHVRYLEELKNRWTLLC